MAATIKHGMTWMCSLLELASNSLNERTALSVSVAASSGVAATIKQGCATTVSLLADPASV
jgi:hypothetical protein